MSGWSCTVVTSSIASTPLTPYERWPRSVEANTSSMTRYSMESPNEVVARSANARGGRGRRNGTGEWGVGLREQLWRAFIHVSGALHDGEERGGGTVPHFGRLGRRVDASSRQVASHFQLRDAGTIRRVNAQHRLLARPR